MQCEVNVNIFSTLKKTILLLLLISSTLHPANIIFDMNGVLVKNQPLTSLWQIGLWNLVGYFKPWMAEEYLYDFLELCEPRRYDTPYAEHKGEALPQILCDWLTGTKTCKEILAIVDTSIKNNPEFFKQHCPKKLIRGTTNFMFTPNRLVKSITLHKKGHFLFNKCRKLTYHTGQPVHRIFILSNWDAESFEYLKMDPKIGAMINAADGVMISGDVHLMKPDPAIFNLLFKTYNIDPDNELTVYIDDEFLNLLAAESLGKKQLHCLHCVNFTEVRKELQQLGIIP